MGMKAMPSVLEDVVAQALDWRAAAMAGYLPTNYHHCLTCGAAVPGGPQFRRHMRCSQNVVGERVRRQEGQSYSEMLISAQQSDDVTRVLAVLEVWHRGPWDRRKGIFRWTGPERRGSEKY